MADEIGCENIGNFLYGQFDDQTYKSRPNSEGSIVKKQSLSCTLSHSPDVIKKSVHLNSSKKSIYCSPIKNVIDEEKDLLLYTKNIPSMKSLVIIDTHSDKSP